MDDTLEVTHNGDPANVISETNLFRIPSSEGTYTLSVHEDPEDTLRGEALTFKVYRKKE